MSSRRPIIAAALLLSSVLSLAQNNRIKINTNLVLVTVTVTDSRNRFVQDLQKEDFQVWEDKIEQELRSFSKEDTPMSLGIILDESGSMGGRSNKNKSGQINATAQERMIRYALSCLPGGIRSDEYFLEEFSDHPTITVDFTRDISSLSQHLTLSGAGGQTALWDAIYLGVRKFKDAVNTRKALLVLTDGDENRSRYSLSELKALVREEEVRIYAIGAEEFPHFDGLTQLAEITGGRLFHSNTPCKELSADLRNQYVIGYSPTNRATDGTWRSIRVRVRTERLPKEMGDFSVRARKGYYADEEN